jgi:polysaccharide export outer membrane protein
MRLGIFKPALLIVLVCAGLMAGQELPSVPNAPADASNQKNQQLERLRLQVNAESDYLLGPGDTIHIDVLNVPELSRDVQINQDGTIVLPFLDMVRVEGLTPVELQKKLESLLGESLLKNPNATVTIKEYRSRPVYLLGEINRPGTYQLTHFMRLVDMFTLAGGFTSTAGDTCAVTRTGPDGQSTRVDIDLRQLLEQGDVSLNIPIAAGDMIMVPKKVEKVFFVLGDVGRPGAYPLPPHKEMNLSAAVSTAGGFNRTAKLTEARLVRMQPDGSRTIVTLNMKKILSGSQQDVMLHENDLLFVPDSKSKIVGYSFLNGISSLVYGGIWRF